MRDIEEFPPAAEPGSGLSITFIDGGRTDLATRFWSGNTLLDMGTREQREMRLKTVNGEVYLFIEAGGFDPEQPAGWKTPWLVMKKKI